MDITDITPQLNRLDRSLDNLEEVIQPLLNNLPDTASQLPLLDKAKLYVLTTYAIESLLFGTPPVLRSVRDPRLIFPHSHHEDGRDRSAAASYHDGAQASPAVFPQDQGSRDARRCATAPARVGAGHDGQRGGCNADAPRGLGMHLYPLPPACLLEGAHHHYPLLMREI